MRNRLIRMFAGVAVLAALGAGGAAFAANGSKAPQPKPASAAAKPAAVAEPKESTTPDTDNVQQGDQTAPDKPANDQADSETESAGESGSEVQGNDGPVGHADEPANSTADHQFEGAE